MLEEKILCEQVTGTLPVIARRAVELGCSQLIFNSAIYEVFIRWEKTGKKIVSEKSGE